MTSLSEVTRESSSFHVTNPITSIVEALSRLSARVENVSDDVFANMFLDVMSNNVSNAEQNSEMLQGSQPNSSRASSDSANSSDKALPPRIRHRDCFGRLAYLEQRINYELESSNIKEWLENTRVEYRSGPMGSGVPMFGASNNSFVGTAVTLSGNRENKETGEPPERYRRHTTTARS